MVNPSEEASSKPTEIGVNKEEPIGVPHIIVESVNKSDLDEIFKHSKLPPIEEVTKSV